MIQVKMYQNLPTVRQVAHAQGKPQVDCSIPKYGISWPSPRRTPYPKRQTIVTPPYRICRREPEPLQALGDGIDSWSVRS